MQYEDADFAALDARLSDYQRGYETRRRKEEVVLFAFSAFEHSDVALEPILNQWVERMPESYAPRLARGIYYSHLGWLSRGQRLASETSEEQASRMTEYFKKAGPDLLRALSTNPKLSVGYGYWLGSGTAYGDSQAVATMVKKGLEEDPYSFLIRRRYANTLQPKWGGSLGDLRLFLEETRPYRSGNPDLKLLDGYVDYTLADNLRDDRRKAIEFLNRALQYGDYWQFLRDRGINYYYLGEYDNALADFDLALRLWPQEPEVLSWRAWTHRKLNKPDPALADLNLAAQLDPLQPRVLHARASLLRDQEKFVEALHDYENALTFGGHDHRIWGSRGWLLLHKLKDYDRAARDLRRATELSPSDPDYWYDYGVALFYKRDCQVIEALEKYRRLCDSGKDCKGTRLTWASTTVARLTTTGRCPG